MIVPEDEHPKIGKHDTSCITKNCTTYVRKWPHRPALECQSSNGGATSNFLCERYEMVTLSLEPLGMDNPKEYKIVAEDETH